MKTVQFYIKLLKIKDFYTIVTLFHYKYAWVDAEK